MAAPLTFSSTKLLGLYVVESKVFADDRGFFLEAHSEEAWRREGHPVDFMQDSMSSSQRGTLRGLHYQIEPHAQGKFVRAVRGALFDVAVDIRNGSPTFGRWFGKTLRPDGTGLWIPPGFAHGFLALEDDTVMYYKCSGSYAPEAERSIAYNDPDIGIDWPSDPEFLSPKDAQAPTLRDADYNFTYHA